MRARSAVAAVALALLAAGCGSDEEKEVRNAIGRFASATETEDARTACLAVTPRTRVLLARLAEARLGRGSCEALLQSRFDTSGGAGIAIDAATLDAVEDADVEIDGDRAEVDTFGDAADLPLGRSGGQWRLDLAGTAAQGYSLRASVSCTGDNAAVASGPLPAATRSGYARMARGLARRRVALARRLSALRPPAGVDGAHAELLAALRGQARELRAIASGVAGGAPVLDTVNRRARALRRLDQRALAANRRLDVACDATAFRRGAEEYRKAADRECRAVSRRIERLGAPAEAGGLGAYMRRVRAAGLGAGRGLARLDAPVGLGELHARSVRAYRRALDAIPAIARAPDPDAAYDRYGLLSLRASTGFTRLGLQACAAL